MADISTIQNPRLVLIRGIPGSGKSFVAAALLQTLGSNRAIILDPDATAYTSPEYVAFSKALVRAGVDLKFHPYRFLRAQAYAAINDGKIVIWNQAFTDFDGLVKTINNLQAYALEQQRELPILLVEVAVSTSVAQQRIADRAAKGGHDVNQEKFARFIADYHSFGDQGFSVVSVNGEADVSKSVQIIQQALKQP